MFYPLSHPHLISEIPTRSGKGGVSFSYTFAGERGAALMTKHKTYREYTVKRATFEQYTKEHYKSWVALVREVGYGDVEPVLVFGVDMTKGFSMAAYSKESSSREGAVAFSVPVFGTTSVSTWGTWSGTGKIHVNRGPLKGILPSMTTGAIPGDHNQCVFVRYYTMRLRGGIIPRLFRAGAGPHDLGSGKNHDSTFPELTARPDQAHDVEYDDTRDHEAQSLAPGDDGSEQNVVAANVPDVRCSPSAHCGL